MRTRPIARAAVAAGALTLTIPAAHADAAAVKKKRLHVRVGHRVVVVGSTTPAGRVWLQVRRRGHWRSLDRDRVAANGRFVLRARVHRPMSVRARIAGAGVRRDVGRLNAYRSASASWYGPGLYGNHLGCGGQLTPGKLGVAHKSLPCGSKVTLRKGSRTVRVRVIDRGPYVGGREFDLTEATARRLHFHGHGAILTTR
jgi:rare lipoprotein A (peptidoglycan hydrolase)